MLYKKIIEARSDNNIDFQALCALLQRLGFEMITGRLHHLFRKTGIDE